MEPVKRPRRARPLKLSLDAVAKIAAWGAPYAISISALYQSGYWGEFGINPFWYAGLTDILAMSIPALILILFGSAGIGVSVTKSVAPSNAAESVVIPTYKRVLAWVVLLLIPVAALLFFWWNVDISAVAAFCAVVIGYGMSLFLFRSARFFPDGHPLLRAIGIIAVVFIPILATVGGSLRAEAIISGRRYNAVGLPKDLLERIGVQNTVTLRFIGHLGNYDFVYAEPSVIVIRSADKDVMLLTEHWQQDQGFRIPFRDAPYRRK